MACTSGPLIVDSGLVLHLDAANLRSYPGSGTTWFDLSGSGNNGILTNGIVYNAASKGSMTFDGVNDYANLNFAFTQSSSANQYTVSIGAKLSSTSVARRQMWGSDDGGFDWGFGSGDSGRFSVFSGDSIYTGRLQDTNWHIFTAQWSSTGTKLYIDDVLDISTPNVSYDSSIASTISIGRNPSYGEYFHGDISFVRLYNRILSAAEIKQNFEAARGRYNV